MADAVFQHKVNQAGLSDKIRVDSAGTSGWHAGETAHRGTLNTLKKHNIPYDGRSRQFITEDFDKFDYILTMDHDNLRDIRRLLSNPANAEVRMFLSYANDAGTVSAEDVPDPYYNNKFDLVYDLVDKGADALLTHIRQQHNL